VAEFPAHSLDVHFQSVKYFQILGTLLVRQLERSWQLLGQAENKWDPVLSFLDLVLAFKPEGRSRFIEEHETSFVELLLLFLRVTAAVATLGH
jgi:hypothetical protein